jgi:hypothetical protein
MTRSKLDLATHLLKLCNDTTTDPQKLADVMTIRKLHFEIEKAEGEIEEIEAKINEVKTKATSKSPRSLWSFLTVEDE